jgi:uncharacterized protein (TIGR00297 family)
MVMNSRITLQIMPVTDILVLVFLFVGGFASAFFKKLTPLAAATGVVLGFLIYKGAGFTGIGMLAAFFVMGTAATSWGFRQKSKLGIAEERGGRRTAGQVFANAGVAGIAGLLTLLFPAYQQAFQLMIAGCFSAAAADTLSSELGNLHGRRFYNILSFKKDQRGLDGVISLEGTLCGVCGSVIIAIIYCVGFGLGSRFLLIVIAGTVGNLTDSVLGATVERKGWLRNNAVNFLNTLVGALLAGGCL